MICPVCGLRHWPSPSKMVKPSGKFGVMACAANSAHSISVSGSRPLMLRPKNNSATSIRCSAGNRHGYSAGWDIEGVCCGGDAAQPASIVKDKTTAKFACSLSNLRDLLPFRSVQHRVEKHIAAGGQVLGFGVFDLVVADAADAGYENHRGGRDARQIDRVVAG